MKLLADFRFLHLLLAGWLLGSIGFASLMSAQEGPEAGAAGAPAGDDEADGQDEGAEDDAAPPPKPAKLDKWGDAHSIRRAGSFSISWPKLLLIWLLFLIWVRSVDWVNRDCQIHDLGYGKWNAIVFFPVFAALLLFVFPFILPIPFNYFVALGVTFVAYLGSFIPYVVVRNKVVERHEKVFTGEWLRYEFALLAGKVGIKIEAERKADYEKGAPVDLMAIGAKEERDNQANLIAARQSPGYLLVKDLVADMANKRSDRVILDYTQQSVVERHHIDGVWQNGEARDRESGDVMLAVMKSLSNLEMTERRKKQVGKFAAKYEGTTYTCPIVSQGVKTGERVAIDLLGGKQTELTSLKDLGMRERTAEQWLEQMGADSGLVIIAGMPEGGVTTLTDLSLMETDRLMRDFVSVEDEHHPDREIENVEVTTYNTQAEEIPATILPKVIRKYPNVIIVRDNLDAEAAKLLLQEIRDERLIVTTVKAKEAPEALLRMLMLKFPQRDFAELVSSVICTRLIRKLCDQCKVGYEPAPEMLKKLGIPASKVEALYRPPKPEEADKPCTKCAGIGYYGRTGLFELLIVDDKIREILAKQPKLELLKKAARAAHMRNFQEEGILLVARGVTSIQELQRVLSQ